MLFSIIVPVYNIEDYLDDCVNSVLAQTCGDWELILVDDGAKDSCPQKCDEWALKDSRIRAVHKPNGGLSSARNYGMPLAQGEWVVFLDGDDTLKENALEVFREKISDDVDMVIGRFVRCSPTGETFPEEFNLSSFEDGSAMNQYGQLLQSCTGESYWSAWHWIYRRELLINNDLYFKEGLLAEDFEWTPRVIMKARKAAITDNIFYCYRISRAGSIIASRSTKLISDIYDSTEKWIQRITTEPCEEIFKVNFYTHMLWVVYSYLPDISRMPPAERAVFAQKATEFSKAPIAANNKKVKILRNIVMTVGAVNLGRALYLAKKLGIYGKG